MPFLLTLLCNNKVSVSYASYATNAHDAVGVEEHLSKQAKINISLFADDLLMYVSQGGSDIFIVFNLFSVFYRACFYCAWFYWRRGGLQTSAIKVLKKRGQVCRFGKDSQREYSRGRLEGSRESAKEAAPGDNDETTPRWKQQWLAVYQAWPTKRGWCRGATSDHSTSALRTCQSQYHPLTEPESHHFRRAHVRVPDSQLYVVWTEIAKYKF